MDLNPLLSLLGLTVGALVLQALAVAWLALEVRLVRCGKVSPRTAKILERPSDQMTTFPIGTDYT